MPPRTGRPPKENPRNANIHIRVTQDEKREIMEYCKATGQTCVELLKSGMKADEK
jgi:hypothetical protein